MGKERWSNVAIESNTQSFDSGMSESFHEVVDSNIGIRANEDRMRNLEMSLVGWR